MVVGNKQPKFCPKRLDFFIENIVSIGPQASSTIPVDFLSREITIKAEGEDCESLSILRVSVLSGNLIHWVKNISILISLKFSIFRQFFSLWLRNKSGVYFSLQVSLLISLSPEICYVTEMNTVQNFLVFEIFEENSSQNNKIPSKFFGDQDIEKFVPDT